MTTIDDFLHGRDAADGQVRRRDARALQHRPHRPRVGGAARPDPDRLLRHADAAQEHRHDQRARAADAHDPAVRPDGDRSRSSARSRSRTSACTPSNDGKIIRLPIPQLTEERRKEFVKLVRNMAEEGRVAVRNVRRDVMRHLEELVKNGEVGDDEERAAESARPEAHRRPRPQDRRPLEAQRGRDHGGLSRRGSAHERLRRAP